MEQNFESYQPVVGRLKSKRWVQASNPNYEGNDWDEEYPGDYNTRQEPMPDLPAGASQLLSVESNTDQVGTDDQDSSVSEFLDAQEDPQPQPVLPLSHPNEKPEIEHEHADTESAPESNPVEDLSESTSKLELESHKADIEQSQGEDLNDSPTLEEENEESANPTVIHPQKHVTPIIGFKSQEIDQYTTSQFSPNASQSAYYDDLRKSIDSLDTDSSASISTGRRSQDQISFLHENDTPLSSQRQAQKNTNNKLPRESLDDSPSNPTPVQPLTPPKETRELGDPTEWDSNRAGQENSNDDSSINEVVTPSDPTSSGHRKQKSESEALTDELLQQLGNEDPRFSYLREPTRYFGDLAASEEGREGGGSFLGHSFTEEHGTSENLISPLGEGSRTLHSEDESNQIRSPIAQSGRNRYKSMILEEFGHDDNHSTHEVESPREASYNPSNELSSSPIAASKPSADQRVGGHNKPAATNSFESLPRQVPSYDFKELMTKPNPDLRKQAFDRARIAEANYSSGLAEWMAYMESASPEVYHKTATREGLRQITTNYNRNFSVTNIISTTSRAGERGVEKISRAGGKSTAAAKGFFSKSRKKIIGS